MRILLITSDPAFCPHLLERLAALGLPAEVDAPAPAEALRMFSDFDKEWRAWLAGDLTTSPEPPFRSADLLISEETLPESGRRYELAPFIWALRGAGQASAFVAVSREARPLFDTGKLRRDCGPFDLLVSAADILSDGLWTGDCRPGAFRPWTWPILLGMQARRAQQVCDLSEGLDRSVQEILSIPESVRARLSSYSASMLSSDLDIRKEPVSPMDILRSGNVRIEPADRNNLVARLSSDRSVGVRHVAARLLAPALEYWLETSVIDQTIVFDAPRFMKMVGLPTSAHARLRVSDVQALRSGEAIAAMFEEGTPLCLIATHWSARAWVPASDVVDLEDRFGFNEQTDRNYVFCDDTSCFKLRSDISSGQVPKRISPELGPGIPVRWIDGRADADYLPKIYVSS
jgi:hypothetical protein